MIIHRYSLQTKISELWYTAATFNSETPIITGSLIVDEHDVKKYRIYDNVECRIVK